ncbi:MAG: YjfB family protein [Lachnospiraceae bacterium]|nr:YjfB family protein [Lachnospiraceae bacterium]MBR3684034.1 YjfB family protein [Lachnospiraceae bacterium]
MSIAALSTQMATQQISLDVGTAMLSKSLDMSATVTDSLTKMMEQSVTPYLGGSIDITV